MDNVNCNAMQRRKIDAFLIKKRNSLRVNFTHVFMEVREERQLFQIKIKYFEKMCRHCKRVYCCVEFVEQRRF